MGVDVGGTKTLLAVFTKDGQLKQSVKFETPQNYSRFLDALTENIRGLNIEDYSAACIAAPGVVDRTEGTITYLGNLPWRNVNIVSYLEKLLKAPVLIENDAKLAGLYEASNIKKDFRKVVYVTISTGIGLSLIVDGIIDENFGDGGGHDMIIENKGKPISWEKLASGKAITQRYGKRASEIDDPKIWKVLARDFSRGIIDIIALIEPDAVVIGGGVGTHFKKYGKFLDQELAKYETPITKHPKLLQAKRPEEAVIYGCYELLKARQDKL